MVSYRLLNELALDAYDAQAAGGVNEPLVPSTLITACITRRQARQILDEVRGVLNAGQKLDIDLLTGEQARLLEPHLSDAITFAVALQGQRYLHPGRYIAALANSVRARGGELIENTPVTRVLSAREKVEVHTPDGTQDADAVIIACGAWTGALAKRHGVCPPIFAGRGYSFTLPAASPFRYPVHFPHSRLALTPVGDRVRVVGVMEFAEPSTPLVPARIQSMLSALHPLICGVEWELRADDWVGPRPLSADGLPVVGRTATPGVYVASGHGMWGMTLGPVTGRLLAEEVVTGQTPPALHALCPMR